MDHLIEQPSSESTDSQSHGNSTDRSPDVSLSHPVLSRLLEEVRNEKSVDAAYDRVHHRHNRGR